MAQQADPKDLDTFLDQIVSPTGSLSREPVPQSYLDDVVFLDFSSEGLGREPISAYPHASGLRILSNAMKYASDPAEQRGQLDTAYLVMGVAGEDTSLLLRLTRAIMRQNQDLRSELESLRANQDHMYSLIENYRQVVDTLDRVHELEEKVSSAFADYEEEETEVVVPFPTGLKKTGRLAPLRRASKGEKKPFRSMDLGEEE